MLDSLIRPKIEPFLDRMAGEVAKQGLSANHVTLIGFCTGMAGCVAAGFHGYLAALLLILVGRLCDGLDGAVARQQGRVSDFGGFADIVADFILYAGFVFFFALGAPHHTLAAAFLLFSYMGTASTFLAYSIIAGKRGMETSRNGEKSFFHASGLVEGSETIAFMVLCCLFPDAFSALAVLFGLLCWTTTAGRVWMARRTFA